MSSETNIAKKFNMDYIDVIERATVFHANLIIDLTALSTPFPNLAAPFAANFLTAIDVADNMPSDEEERSNITYKVLIATNLAESARVMVQECYAYVKLAFGDVQAIAKNFGKGEVYTLATNSNKLTKELIERVHRTCENEDFKAPLIAKGFTQAKIDALEDKMIELEQAIAEADYAQSARLMKTYNRITAYNDVWSKMVEISDAAKIVFRENPAKLSQYKLYPSSNVPHKVQNLAYISELNKLIWDSADNATVYVIEAMMQAPISMPSFEQVGESAVNEWTVVLAPGTYAFRVKGKNGGLSGPYSDYIAGIVINP